MKTKSFISTSKLNDAYYPQKIQSKLIKLYSFENHLEFSLPITEQLDSFDIFEKQIFNTDLEHLIFFSKMQLGLLGKRDLDILRSKMNSGVKLHFALETDCISTLSELEKCMLELKLFRMNTMKESQEKLETLRKNVPFRGRKTDFITKNHLSSKRDYQSRAHEEKPRYAALAKKFDEEYWDGARETGYGGYKDDGRWERVAKKMIDFYNLSSDSAILDIGCGKGYLLKEFKKAIPSLNVWGIDISRYALEKAAIEIKDNLTLGNATSLPFENDCFDLVLSNMTLHNLELPDLKESIREMNRVSRQHKWIGVESYITEEQKWNLMRWQLTCECFFTPREWESIFVDCGYEGDYELIFFD